MPLFNLNNSSDEEESYEINEPQHSVPSPQLPQPQPPQPQPQPPPPQPQPLQREPPTIGPSVVLARRSKERMMMR